MYDYAKRNKLLKELNFQDYKAYLASDLWAKIRTEHLLKYPDCYGCGRKATQVHHGRYTREVLLGLSTAGLFTVCGGCHFTIEFTQDDRKRTVKRATKQLYIKRKFWDGRKPLALSMYAPERENVDTDYKRRLEREP